MNEIKGQPYKHKAIEAAKLLMEKFNLQHLCKGLLRINSEIPPGKGMASSSADIVSTIRSLSNAFNLEVTEELISEIATEIEPTDGIMYNIPCIYRQKTGVLIKELPLLNNLRVLGIDCGGQVDTIAQHSKSIEYSSTEKAFFEEVVNSIESVLEDRNTSKLFEYIRNSSIINQKILPKKNFNFLLDLSYSYNCGLIVAHSGTVAGLVLDKMEKNYLEKEKEVRLHLKKITSNILDFDIISHYEGSVHIGS